MAKHCLICGASMPRSRTSLCSVTCRSRYMKQRRARYKELDSRYATVKQHRCDTCGAKIDTKHCYACDMQARQDERLELERHLKSENTRLRERFSNQPEPAKALGREPTKVRSDLCHPDIIASPNGCDGIRHAGARPDAPAKRRRKRDRGDTGLGADKQRSAAG